MWTVPSRLPSKYWIIESIPPCVSAPRPVPLTSLSYFDGVWRELRERPYHARFPHTARIDDEYEAEAKALAPLVLGMRTTAQSLRIPFDTSPVLEMCMDAWPHLTDLAFRGFYPESMPLSTMPTLLSRMPRLRNLSIEVAQPPCHSRAPIFGATAPPGCELLNIRSLTVAYPDPDDAIFSCISPDLMRLSLRDWPRHYYFLSPRVSLRFTAPILSASECLRILSRTNALGLQYLEVVYLADDAIADDALLHHIATAYPHLSQLDLHRYRPVGDENDTPYEHIAGILAPLGRCLRSLRLNLDFKDAQPAMLFRERQTSPAHWRWGFNPIFLECATSMLKVLRVGNPPSGVEHVDLLMHSGRQSVWQRFLLECGECVWDVQYRWARLCDTDGLFDRSEWKYVVGEPTSPNIYSCFRISAHRNCRRSKHWLTVSGHHHRRNILV
ncbi:hypothetical protein C8Q77DRAFT_730776 [Trametes polyzona]|nr:hypothetical protein C8Q77DRAFT_730776 [Trametes polyzona]